MTSLKPEAFEPIAEHRAVYDQLYALYRELHDSFGGLTQIRRPVAGHEEAAGYQICAAGITVVRRTGRKISPPGTAT